MEKKFDVVVIGSGVAGSLISYRLAKSGAKVLILEAGEKGRERVDLVNTYLQSTSRSLGSPYRIVPAPAKIMAPAPDGANDYYDQPLVANDPMAFQSTFERRVGGTTWHWLGNCPRLIPNDFKTETLYGFGKDWPITYNDLEPWYCEAEEELGVSGDHEELNSLFGATRSKPFPMKKIWPSYSDLQITNALKGSEQLFPEYNNEPLVLKSTPQARNSKPYDGRPPCEGNSSCVPICPIGAKYDASVHVNKAIANHAILLPQSIVKKINAEPNGRIRSVEYINWEGKAFTVKAKIFVLAANAIESAKILLMSGVANSSDQVGRNLMDHPQGEAVCSTKEPLFPFRGPPTTSGIDKFRDGNFRKDFCAFRLSMGNDGGGRTRSPQSVLEDILKTSFGTKMRSELKERVIRLFRISFLSEMKPLPENRITLSTNLDDAKIPRPKIAFTIDDYTMNGFVKISQVMKAILLKLNPVGDLILPDNHSPFKPAGHIMGTCRMGNDASTSVVDANCRAHDHANLFIAGSSVFPTGGTANPTLTVSAIALRIADTIQKQLAT